MLAYQAGYGLVVRKQRVLAAFDAIQVLAARIQGRLPNLGCVVPLVGDVVGLSTETIQRYHRGAQTLRKQYRGNRKILVVINAHELPPDPKNAFPSVGCHGNGSGRMGAAGASDGAL